VTGMKIDFAQKGDGLSGTQREGGALGRALIPAGHEKATAEVPGSGEGDLQTVWRSQLLIFATGRGVGLHITEITEVLKGIGIGRSKPFLRT